MLPMLKNYLAALKSLILPSLCFACEKKISQGYLCLTCQEKIEFLSPVRCRLCYRQLANNQTSPCRRCHDKSFPYERLISIAAYKEPLISLIHSFKYDNYEYLAELLSSFMIKHLARIGVDLCGYDFITSVPLHASKLRQRGYNQSSLLAKLLANYFKISFKDGIIYEKEERISQTKLLKQKRQQNVKGIFIVKERLEGKKIILIDDIFTTGATAKECATALKEKGAQTVTIITLAKT
jgi:ComF family protein